MRLFRILGIGVIAVTIAACTFASKTYAPDGRQAFTISCDGLANTWAGCFKKAGSICQERGYDTFSQSGDSGVLISGTPVLTTGTSVVSRTLIIACKAEAATDRKTE
jgi:hypothetical protein